MSPKQDEIRNFIDTFSRSCLGIIETKIQLRKERCGRRFYILSWKLECNYKYHPNCRIFKINSVSLVPTMVDIASPKHIASTSLNQECLFDKKTFINLYYQSHTELQSPLYFP